MKRNNEQFVTLSETAKLLGVTENYLRYVSEDFIKAYRTEGGHRRYKRSDIDRILGTAMEDVSNIVVCYSRVSSQDQKNHGDLDRQKLRNMEYCVSNGYSILENVEECSSGMNDNRPKLKHIIKIAQQGRFGKLIIEHKDRLTRFNFNMFVTFFNALGVEVICTEETLSKSFENELVEDMLSLITVFSAKIYGRRGKKKIINEDKSS